ncbi:MAG: DUF4450 domain-containing protein, partial [Clostridia bacterium]|nr:DUF4450 domain-containing protein [Clostridia bacterium]
SGLSGYGRFAVVSGGKAKWLDEFDIIETEYSGGMMIYKAADQLTGGKKVTVKFIPSADDPGLVIDMDSRELDGGAEIYLLHGGMLGWNCHSPLKIPYCPDMCWGNRLGIGGGLAEIVMTGKDCDPAFPDCPVSRFSKYDGHIGDSAASAWLYIKGWEKKVLIRAEGEISAAPADSLIDFRPDRLKPLGEAYGAAVCVRFGAGKRSLAAVGFGGRIAEGSLVELEENSVRRLERITGTMTVKSDDTVLDGASVIASLASRAIFGDNVFTHGAVSWKEGFLGWRGTYGPAAFGMTDEVKKHFEYHFRYSRITEGPDRGALCDTIENAGPKNTIFYGMYETAVDQAKNYWEYTGDREFEKDLLDVAEGCISRACRRLKPGKEMLFENSLNTWISDSHWTIMGQCAQSTAYMYNMYRLAARLSDDDGKKGYYAGKADEIKKDLNDVLWQKRRGIFAYARDMRGNHLIHPDAELADIYHPIEFGLTDKYQAFQMLDWAESNLKIERTDNGGTLFWSSGWYPNAGRTYTHSTYELNMGEEMNLALAYMYTGLTEKGYDVFKTA